MVFDMGVGAATAAAGAAIGYLRDLNVDEETIAEIRKVLDMGLESMNAPFPGVPQGVFGGSAAGSELGRNTDLAHQAVFEAMITMGTGLGNYRESVDMFKREVESADKYSADESRRNQSQVDAVTRGIATPNFRTNEAAPPSTEGN